MSDRAAKFRAIADKLSETISRLTAALAACKPGTKKLEQIEAQLARARSRLPKAVEDAEAAEMRERERKLKRSRIEAANVGYMKRLDAIKADAPSLKATWKKDREEEQRKLDARRKQLRRRTYKDTQGDPLAAERQHAWWRKPTPLPEPVQQPDLTAHADENTTVPPREGLIPGTFKMVEPSRLGRIVDQPRAPTVWTARYVGVRLIEGHRVLARMPATIWPKQYGAAWPAYRHEAGELAIQAGTGTLFFGRNSIARGASAEEVARCNQAISWPLQFLSHRPLDAADVNRWASEESKENGDADFDGKRAPWGALQMIADALNAAREPVT